MTNAPGLRRLQPIRRATAAAASCCALIASALAQPAPAGSAPFRDPGVPPALRADAPPAVRAQALEAMRAAPHARGTALQAQAEDKLRASFDAADIRHRGRISREEASRGGFGYVARHFEEIDLARAGAVTFDDVLRYVRGLRPGDASASAVAH